MAAIAPAIVIRLHLSLSSRKREQKYWTLARIWWLVFNMRARAPEGKLKRQKLLEQRFSKCDSWTSCIHTTWELIRKAHSQSPPQTCCFWNPIFILKAFWLKFRNKWSKARVGCCLGFCFLCFSEFHFFPELEAFSCLMPWRPCVQSTWLLLLFPSPHPIACFSPSQSFPFLFCFLTSTKKKNLKSFEIPDFLGKTAALIEQRWKGKKKEHKKQF